MSYTEKPLGFHFHNILKFDYHRSEICNISNICVYQNREVVDNVFFSVLNPATVSLSWNAIA